MLVNLQLVVRFKSKRAETTFIRKMYLFLSNYISLLKYIILIYDKIQDQYFFKNLLGMPEELILSSIIWLLSFMYLKGSVTDFNPTDSPPATIAEDGALIVFNKALATEFEKSDTPYRVPATNPS